MKTKMQALDSQTIAFFLSIAAAIGVMFSVYLHFKNPQIKSAQEAVRLRKDLDALEDVVTEVKEKHLRSVEKEMKGLTTTIHHLTLTVTKLSTIIDERMPKTS